MIKEDIFNILYIFSCLLLFYFSVLFSLANDLANIKTRRNGIQYTISILILISITLIVGLRDISVGTDTKNYYNYYWLSTEPIINQKKDLLILVWMSVIKIFTTDYQVFLFLNSALFSFLFFISAIKISKNYGINILFFILTYYSMFFMKSIEINIIRQGLSLLSLLLGYQYYIEKKNKRAITLSIISILFHYTSIIPIIAFTLSRILKNIKISFVILIYALSLLLSFFGFSIKDASTIVTFFLEGDRRISYLYSETTKYRTGFRYDFALFNTFFLILFLYIYKKIREPQYKILLIFYIISSSLFFLSFQIPYSDRVGLFSWFSIPLLYSPLLKNDRKKNKTIAIIFLLIIFLFFTFY